MPTVRFSDVQQWRGGRCGWIFIDLFFLPEVIHSHWCSALLTVVHFLPLIISVVLSCFWDLTFFSGQQVSC